MYILVDIYQLLVYNKYNTNDWWYNMARNIDNKYENMFRWMSNKLRIQDRFIRNNQSNIKYPRGAIYACYFGENIGHEKSRLEARPCVVVSNNRINYNSTVKCEDIRSVSKARMGKYICKIDVSDMNEIRKRIKKTLQI